MEVNGQRKTCLLSSRLSINSLLLGRYDAYGLEMAKTLTRQEANQLKFHGVEVFGIAVGHRVDNVEMVGISSGARNYFRVDSIDQLETSRLFKILLNKVCSSESYMCIHVHLSLYSPLFLFFCTLSISKFNLCLI